MVNNKIGTIRKVIKEDLTGLKQVLDSSKLFPSEYLDDMISSYFNNSNNEEIWFTSIDNNIPIAIGYCVPEKLTDGTYNLYAIAVRKELQGQGIGKEMMNFIEVLLKQMNKRILIVETSSDSNYSLTRKFYENLSYKQEAVIRDFWKEGEDKVIYWKKL